MVAQGGNAIGIQFVDAASAVAAISDQSRILEHAQMLRDRGAGDGDASGQIVDGAGMLADQGKDSQAGRIAESGEAGLYVSIH